MISQEALAWENHLQRSVNDSGRRQFSFLQTVPMSGGRESVLTQSQSLAPSVTKNLMEKWVISNWKLLFLIAINKQTNKIFLYYEGSRNTERIWASKRPKKHWGWAQNMMYVIKYKMKVVEGESCSWTLMIFKSSNLGLDSPIKTDHKFTITRHRMRSTAYRK